MGKVAHFEKGSECPLITHVMNYSEESLWWILWTEITSLLHQRFEIFDSVPTKGVHTIPS